MLARDIGIANMYVCQSVTVARYGSPIILVLPALNIFPKFRRGHPLQGAKYRWGRKIRDILPISRYISQTIQNIAMVTIEGE